MNKLNVIVLVASVMWCGIARSAERPGVVLLPLDNLSGVAEAPQQVSAALMARLERRGWKVITDDAVEAVLERNRVRYLDSVTDRVRVELAEATGASALMLATISTFRSGDAAVVTLSARLIGADGSLLWSNVGGARADQTERMLGGAKHTGPDDLSQQAVQTLTSDLPAPGQVASERLAGGGRFMRHAPTSFIDRSLVAGKKPRICILPFDSTSQVPEASLVIANTFALRLASAGNFDVVEPAELRAASLKARIGSFISLGSEELAELGKIVGTSLFLRGTISKYVDSSQQSGSVVPEVELDLFLVDVEAGRVLWSASHSRSGSDYVGLLLLGGVFDGATLADRLICELAVAERRAAGKHQAVADAHPGSIRKQRQTGAKSARKDN